MTSLVPNLTIVTVTKNDLIGLQATIDSIDIVFRNHQFLVEHLIIDACSTDGTVQFTNTNLRPSNLYQVFISEPDNGIYDAMNKGIKLASGVFLIFLNAGDYFSPHFDLSNLITNMKKAEGSRTVAGIAYSSIIRFISRDCVVKPRALDTPYRMPSVHQSMVYKREVLLLYPYSISFRICGDFENFVRIFSAGLRFDVVDHVLSIFIPGGASTNHPLVLYNESVSIFKTATNCNKYQLFIYKFRLLIKLALYQIFYKLN